MASLPPRLRAGDTVALVAPSGPVDPVRLTRGAGILAGLGLNVVSGARLTGTRGFLAGPDSDRAADLQEAWCDPAVAAVICVRGGYGATRLLDLLDWDAMKAASPKILLGSSDITALHLAFARRLDLATVFGPMPACATISDPEGPEPRSFGHLRETLFEGAIAGAVTGDRVIVPGRAEGRLAGGNLTLLAALCGTPHALRTDGHIVLLEDVGEEPYRIDRMLTQLLQAGCLDGAAGFVLGSWVGCCGCGRRGQTSSLQPGERSDQDHSCDLMEVLIDRLAPLGVPVIAGLPIGHGSPQFSVWLEADGVIDTESCSLAGLFRDSERAP